MKRHWFTPMGWVYRPASWEGVLSTLAAVAFCVSAFLAIDSHAHSVSDTLYGTFPFIVPTFLLLDWVASKTGGGRA